MRRSNNLLFWIALGISVCGGMFMIADMFSPRALETTARLLLAVGCIAIVFSSAFGTGVKRAPVYSGINKAALKSNDRIITLDDVAANTEAKRSVTELVDYIRCPEKYTRLGARMPRGIILYGPPGTGKTLLARALAGEAGVPFFAMSGSDFIQMYVGVGAGRIRDLFAEGRKAGKCVIFIDEIDALGKRRSDAASDERDQTLNALLSEMSGFRGDEGILILAATNRIETLDPALLRPGRFDRHIEVGLPRTEERLDILKLHCRNKPMSDDIDLLRLAMDTCAFSGAALETLLNEAAIVAAQRNSERIERCDLNTAYYRTVVGGDGSKAADADERCAIAIHEAGHAVVLKKLMPDKHLKRISILAGANGAAGYNLAIPQERVLLKKGDMENQIAVLLAGRAAELLVGGNDALTSGASNDLARAAELAGSMIMELGMGDEPAVAERVLSGICGGTKNTEMQCRSKLNEMYERAKEILTEHIELLVRLTDMLLDKEVLDEDDINTIFDTE